MEFIKGRYRKNIPDSVSEIKNIIDFDNVQNLEQNGYDLSKIIDNVQSILLSNKNVQTVKAPSDENTLIFISSTEDKTSFNNSVDLIIESNISINGFLYPSEFIEECTEDIWFYPNLDLIVLKYDGDILIKLV